MICSASGLGRGNCGTVICGGVDEDGGGLLWLFSTLLGD